MCGRRHNVTRHHIRRGHNPKAVYICRRHHDIIHGIALDKKNRAGSRKNKYVHRNSDLRMVMTIGKAYKLFKSGERGYVTKRIALELQRRANEARRNNRNNHNT